MFKFLPVFSHTRFFVSAPYIDFLRLRPDRHRSSTVLRGTFLLAHRDPPNGEGYTQPLSHLAPPQSDYLPTRGGKRPHRALYRTYSYQSRDKDARYTTLYYYVQTNALILSIPYIGTRHTRARVERVRVALAFAQPLSKPRSLLPTSARSPAGPIRLSGASAAKRQPTFPEPNLSLRSPPQYTLG